MARERGEGQGRERRYTPPSRLHMFHMSNPLKKMLIMSILRDGRIYVHYTVVDVSTW